MQKSWKDKYIEVGDIEAHYIEAGEGEPLVLIHGGGAASSGPVNYGDVMQPLSEHFRVIAPDVIGFGKTPGRGPQDYPADAQGDFLINFIKELNIEPYIGGNSHGGWLSQYVAHEIPERIRKLVIINSLNGSNPIPPEPEGKKYIYGTEGHAHEKPTIENTREKLKEFYYNEGLVTEDRVQLYYEMANRNHEFAKQRAIEMSSTVEDLNKNLEYKGEHISKYADKLGMPVLLTWSRENVGASPGDAFSLFNRISDVEMHVFSKAKHHVQTEHPQKWSDVVTMFLKAN